MALRVRGKGKQQVLGARPTVYFIQSESGGPVMIGKTSKGVKRRLGSLQTGRVDRLIVLATTTAYSEEYLHERFRAWRIRGEWFRPSLTLLRWVQACASVTNEGHRQLAKASVWDEEN